jgi:glucokinase
VPLAAALRQALGVPAYVDHDTRAAVAWLLQRGGGPGSLAYLSVGTGISAAVAIDGRILRGVSGLAGEIGHVVAVPDGPPCACGLAGCLEAVAAGPALERRTGRRPEEVYLAAADGDAEALAVTREVGGHLARAIRGIALAYGVDRIVIGGGLSRAGQPFLEPILEALDREREASALVRQALPPGSVQLLAADAEAGAWGGVVIARTGLSAASTEPGVQREVADG